MIRPSSPAPDRFAWLRVLVALLAAAVLSTPRHVAAGPAPDKAMAATLFKAGAEAYAENNYLAALHAFRSARAIISEPALTFSIAQAHRRQYYLDRSSRQLRSSVREFRRYLTEVAQGGRRGDALEALAELEPLFEALPEDEQARGGEATRVATRLMVLSAVEGASVTVDSGPAEKAPFIGEIEPGPHRVRVEAPGYHPYERSFQARPGDVVPIDANLDELAAQLFVTGDEGATLWVDGHRLAVLPLAEPITVRPGRRTVSVTLDGHRRFEIETGLKRAERKDLSVSLETTAQRTVSIVAIALGVSAAVAGGVFAAVAGERYARTNDVYERAQQENVAPEELSDYHAARTDHQPWTVAAVATGAVGLALTAVGGMLFALDEASQPSVVGASPATASEGAWVVGPVVLPRGVAATAVWRF